MPKVNELSIPFVFDKETENFFVFKKSHTQYPGMFPHKIYLDKEYFGKKTPRAITISFKESEA